LLYYCTMYPTADVALREWYYELLKCECKNFNDLKKIYGSVSLVGDDRVVFNIMGNKYRLIVRIVFEFKAIQIKWFGSHSEYDKINAATIQYKKKQS
jgi:mRNA interferase HigB